MSEYVLINVFFPNWQWAAGQLRKVDPATGLLTDQAFEFRIHPNNHNLNQRHYEALGEVMHSISISCLTGS